MNQVWQEIQQKLELLKRKVQKPDFLEFFGASKHKYCLNPCLIELEIQDFERHYKDFLSWYSGVQLSEIRTVLLSSLRIREITVTTMSKPMMNILERNLFKSQNNSPL